jgi:uncharacterized damage-inducible protein DinB
MSSYSNFVFQVGVSSMAANPEPATDERGNLLSFLAHQRHVLRVSAYGLTDDQARATPSASSLSVGGLVKHVTQVERNWISLVLQQPSAGETDYFDGFTLREDQTLAGLLDDYALAADETSMVIAKIDDLSQPVPVPKGVPWFPQDLEAWSVRWVLGHLIQETARHAGHADIVRESVDGATAMSLMAASEGWAETPWVKPWSPVQQPSAG